MMRNKHELCFKLRINSTVRCTVRFCMWLHVFFINMFVGMQHWLSKFPFASWGWTNHLPLGWMWASGYMRVAMELRRKCYFGCFWSRCVHFRRGAAALAQPDWGNQSATVYQCRPRIIAAIQCFKNPGGIDSALKLQRIQRFMIKDVTSTNLFPWFLKLRSMQNSCSSKSNDVRSRVISVRLLGDKKHQKTVQKVWSQHSTSLPASLSPQKMVTFPIETVTDNKTAAVEQSRPFGSQFWFRLVFPAKKPGDIFRTFMVSPKLELPAVDWPERRFWPFWPTSPIAKRWGEHDMKLRLKHGLYMLKQCHWLIKL